MNYETNQPALRLEHCLNTHCPWSGKPVRADSLAWYRNHVIGFCNPGCRDQFQKACQHFDQILHAGQSPGRTGTESDMDQS